VAGGFMRLFILLALLALLGACDKNTPLIQAAIDGEAKQIEALKDRCFG